MKGMFTLLAFLGLNICYATPAPANEHSTNIAQNPTTELIIHPDKIYVPEILTLETIKEYEKTFNFDWTNLATIAENKKRIPIAEAFFTKTKPQELEKLAWDDKQALGRILYKLGAFYAHVNRDPDKAIKYLEHAEDMFNNKKDKAWNYNQLAYAYELKYAKTENSDYQNKSTVYVNKVLTYFPTTNNNIIAFSYLVRGALNHDAKAYQAAEEDYRNALSIYEKLREFNDGPYAVTKTYLATILLEVKNENDQALKLLLDVQRFWQKQGSLQDNPHAAKNLVLLGQAYLKLNKVKPAQVVLWQALKIYSNLYGNNSEFLEQPYQLLADSYKILGNQKSADIYQTKANDVNKS